MTQLSTSPCKLFSVGSESEQEMFEHYILCLARIYFTTVFKNKWLATDLSPRRAMLDTRAIFVEFVDEVTGRRVVLFNTLVFPFHYYFTNVPCSYFMYLMSTLYRV